MTRIIDIEKVIETLFDDYEGTTTFDVSFVFGDDTIKVLENDDFLDAIDVNYHDMSYISHKPANQDIAVFLKTWELYKKKHLDEWERIFYTQQVDQTPIYDYMEQRTITPDLSVSNTVTYGRTSTNSGGVANTTTHGKKTSVKTNTYDGTEHNAGETAESGTTSNSSTDTTKNTLGGNDKSVTRTQGTSSEEKHGYKTNPYDNYQKYIEYMARFNLRDMIINGFTKECLFYDNGNEGYYDDYFVHI